MYVFQQAAGTNARGIFSGETFLCDHNFSSDSQRRCYEPPGVSVINRNFKAFAYNGRYYMAGSHCGPMLIDEHYRLMRQGMMPPIKPPAITDLGGGTAANQICYISFWDEKTGERSSLSDGTEYSGTDNRQWGTVADPLPRAMAYEILQCEGTATITGGTVTGTYTNFDMMRPGDGIIHSSAPTRPMVIRRIDSAVSMVVDDTTFVAGAGTLTYVPVSRVTHVELWVSVEGALPRLAGRARVGHDIFGEHTPELSLGEAFLDNFQPFPNCSMNAFYQDRQLMAGDDRHRDTLYVSELFYPERYAGLNFKTRNGDPITGVIGTRDYALVYTYTSTYMLQGYTEDDMSFRLIAPDCGAFGHTTNCLVGDVPWQFNQRGGFIFNGAHHNQTLERKTEWQRLYLTAPVMRTTGFAVHNPGDYTVQFWPGSAYYASGDADSTGFYRDAAYVEAWIADYSQQVSDPGGGISQPNWGNDAFTPDPGMGLGSNYPVTSAAYLVPTDMGVGSMFYGFWNGRVFMERLDYNNFVTEAVVRTGALDFGAPGGDVQEGKTLVRLWSYVVGPRGSDDFAARIYARGGDEYGFEDVYPEGIANYVFGSGTLLEYPWKDDYTGSPLSGTYGGHARKIVHNHSGVERVVGRRFVFQLVFTDPLGVRFIGFGGVYGPGPAYRGLVSAFGPGLALTAKS